MLVGVLSLLVRALVALFPYSGQHTPPLYGDYEAQRHWMEITLHLPPSEWYYNSSSNDLLWWGLDYPPLTAYGSWLCGWIANYFDPRWVALHTSRGWESPESKAFMRATVLVSDILFMFPAVFLFAKCVLPHFTRSKQIAVSFIILLQPGLILIDHGHFQYNCVSLGLALYAIVAVTSDHDILGSVLFCLSLNYKQMSLYFAPAFFSYLLGKALHSNGSWLRKVILLGVTVIATFAICWAPFLSSLDSALQVLHRLFPFSRGLFEDKVANFWCVSSLLIKYKALFDQQMLVRLSTLLTLLGLLPSNFMLLRRPNPTLFLYGLVNSALAFFLFSYQVHEKSILLAALPASLLIVSDPFDSILFLLSSAFSMFPLLFKEGLSVPYSISIIFFLIVVIHISQLTFRTLLEAGLINQLKTLAVALSFIVGHGVWHFYTPPPHLPDIPAMCFAVLSFLLFSTLAASFHLSQWRLYHTLWTPPKHTKQS